MKRELYVAILVLALVAAVSGAKQLVDRNFQHVKTIEKGGSSDAISRLMKTEVLIVKNFYPATCESRERAIRTIRCSVAELMFEIPDIRKREFSFHRWRQDNAVFTALDGSEFEIQRGATMLHESAYSGVNYELFLDIKTIEENFFRQSNRRYRLKKFPPIMYGN